MGSKRNIDITQEDNKHGSMKTSNIRKSTIKTPSLKTLINWNVSKALKSEPQIDLKAALRRTQERLECAHDVETLVCPDARNLSCALLAWQQLGHRHADSLFNSPEHSGHLSVATGGSLLANLYFKKKHYHLSESEMVSVVPIIRYAIIFTNFVEQTLKEESDRKENIECLCDRTSSDRTSSIGPVTSLQNELEHKDPRRKSCQWGGPAKMDFSTSIGLVVKLPAEPQTLLHVSGPIRVPKKTKCCARGEVCPIKTAIRIDSACCLDKGCMEQLMKMEEETKQLRKRAAQVARRESERAELLERAEIAWRDLDCGYQRRLQLAKEKEDDYEKHTARLLDERNRYKELCVPLVTALKKKSVLAETEQDKLKQLEKAVCQKACARHQLAERAAQFDTQITDQQCRASQLERNLALKEEQERRKQRALAGAAEAAQVLSHEAEYSQRAELEMLRKEVQKVLHELVAEDARTTLLKQRIEDYMQEKDEMIQDLEACQTQCDGRMAGLVQDLKNKREKVAELEDKVMECLCKEPVDRAVEVKRTPSLAALCRCTPSEVLVACSCTSMRSRLLSALLKDLFGGLKSEMESIGSQMPCHLLKCLEDRHNWDRATDVKQNVRAYFSQLLLGELDIAIAIVIEKCHAQWVGECCVDQRKPAIAKDSLHSLRWQENELEMKAQKMATKLAEKMFNEKAKELASQAQDVLTKDGRPPCECDHDIGAANKEQYSSAVFRCQVHPRQPSNSNKLKSGPAIVADNIIHRKEKPLLVPTGSSKKNTISIMNTLHATDKMRKKDENNLRPERNFKNNGVVCKPAATRRISNARKITKGDAYKAGKDASNKVIKCPQHYAVNMCLCDNKNDFASSKSHDNCQIETDLFYDNILACHVSNLKQTKPVILVLPENNSIQESEVANLPLCTEKTACFHKAPSTTSVDKLINILTKLKDNLLESDNNIRDAVNTDSLFKITHTSILNVLQQLGDKTETKYSGTNANHFAVIGQDVKLSQECKKTVKETDNNSSSEMSSQIRLKESQYMGAVNLNDPFYKCPNDTKGLEQFINSQLNNIHLVKSIGKKSVTAEPDIQLAPIVNSFANKSTHLYNSFDITTPVNKTNNTDINIFGTYSISRQKGEKCIQCLGATLANIASKISLRKNAKEPTQSKVDSHFLRETKNNYNKSEGKRKNNINYNTSNNYNDTNEIGDMAKFSIVKPNNNSEDYIKFLGVTLGNVNKKVLSKQDVRTQIIKNPDKKNIQFEFLNNKGRCSHDKSYVKRYKSNTRRDLRKNKYAFKRLQTVNVLHVNECGYPCDNKKQSIDNNSVEIRNANNTIEHHEPCVCCPTSNMDNSNDLEVNTFQLLEEHLKCQLEEFKHTTCKSSCIQNADDKNLFGDTLLKVKKLILESAGTVTCKCIGNKPSNGSWNRAYGLLQEYLKTKIDHVKCLCDSTDNRDENLVPRVLSKINCLIENDLQRLKGVCKCNMTSDISKPEPDLSHEPQYIGDTNNCNTMAISNTTEHNYMSTSQMVESVLVSYTNDPTLAYNKSAQVLLRQSVVTKSCDTLKTYSKYSEVQTVDVLTTNLTNGYNEGEANDDYSGFPKKDKDVSNLRPDIQRNGASIEVTHIQKRDFTVLPIVISSGTKIKENDSKDNAVTVQKVSVDDKNLNDLGNFDNKVIETFLPYIGCTINCSCDNDLGCVCAKSTTPKNLLKTNDIWNTFTQKQRVDENYSYILNKICSNKIPKNVNYINVTDNSHVTDIIQINNLDQSSTNIGINNENNAYPDQSKQGTNISNIYYNTEKVQGSKTNLCEYEKDDREENNIYLKDSKQMLHIVHGATNTPTDDYLLQLMPPKSKHQGILKQNKCESPKHAPIFGDNSESTVMTDHASQRSETCSTDCDCAMVPICHVKMLVESIGNKLVKAECTCDSLKSVCPIHS